MTYVYTRIFNFTNLSMKVLGVGTNLKNLFNLLITGDSMNFMSKIIYHNCNGGNVFS